MSDTVIGTCSICGGPVTVPTLWSGIFPPVPTCSHCGATKKKNYGPVVDMEPRKEVFKTTITGDSLDWDSTPKYRRSC